MATPLSVFKKVKNGTLARKRNGAIGLKLGMQTQLDSSNNMGWVPSGHTSSSLWIRLKYQQKIVLLKTPGPRKLYPQAKTYSDPNRQK